MERIPIHTIPGFSFGQVEDRAGGTGCTVILCPQGAVTGVDVRGGSPGTRDTDALDPVCNREVVHAVVLTGGSAFGLDAAGGVMRKLEEEGIGRDVMVTVVPNVCAAVLFDLKCGAMDARPDVAMGYAACQEALLGKPFQEGNFGAGTGCTIGKIRGPQYAMKGGIGACAFRQGELMVGAVMACNAMGDVVENGAILAGAGTTTTPALPAPRTGSSSTASGSGTSSAASWWGRTPSSAAWSPTPPSPRPRPPNWPPWPRTASPGPSARPTPPLTGTASSPCAAAPFRRTPTPWASWPPGRWRRPSAGGSGPRRASTAARPSGTCPLPRKREPIRKGRRYANRIRITLYPYVH